MNEQKEQATRGERNPACPFDHLGPCNHFTAEQMREAELARQRVGDRHQMRYYPAAPEGVEVGGRVVDSFKTQQDRAQGKTFSRTEVLAIIRGYRATWNLSDNTDRTRAAEQVFDELLGVFGRVE